MAEKTIHGAVSVGDKTFVAGQEKEFEAAVAAAPDKGKVDLKVLGERGVISGFGHDADETPASVNRQRNEDGSAADPKAAEKKGAAPKAAPAKR